MKTEYEIPKDSTHYFLWWDGVHVYKRENGKWYDLINGRWVEPVSAPYHKIVWRFGWYQMSGSYKHKLHKITYAV